MVLTVEELGKSYGEKVLFSHVNLNVNEGDKIGIVGVNGTGKSTFLKTVAGRMTADTGSMVTMRNLRISFLEQSKEYIPEHTILNWRWQNQKTAIHQRMYSQCWSGPRKK